MKIYSFKISFFIIFLFLSLLSFSQNEEKSLDSIFGNWVLCSTTYVEQNLETAPRMINSWILRTFYAYPEENNRYESLNGSVLFFLKINFEHELFNDKLFFIQKHTGFGCRNDYSFFILTKKSELTKLHKNFSNDSTWKKEKTSNLNFEDFEKKFKKFKDYEVIEDPGKMLLAFYIITEFDKGKVTQKIILD